MSRITEPTGSRNYCSGSLASAGPKIYNFIANVMQTWPHCLNLSFSEV